MAHLRLGEILVSQGLITEEQLQAAIQSQSKSKERIGELLVKKGILSEEEIFAALATQLGMPYISSEKADLLIPKEDQNLDTLVPRDFASKNVIIPLSKHMNSLTCAISDPLDLLILDNLKRITGCEINPVLASKKAILKSISAFYYGSGDTKNEDSKPSLLDAAVERSYSNDSSASEEASFSISDNKSVTAELSLDKLIQKAEEAPVVKLVDLIIRQAIDERASDIHIEPYQNKIILRYRIDGHLFDIPPPAPHLHLPIVSRIKILSKLDIAEKRLPQDGAIAANLENRSVDLRVSTIPTIWGEKVVMRILDKETVPLDLSRLGFDTKQIEILRKALKSPYGLFFVTGPTGSGKSTTLYAALNETIDSTKNVVTVEDPVEYKVARINQVSVRSEIGLTFASALKAFLRQDPDVIMVGEVRDIETAQICVRSALTGHFVLSTLHTNDAASAITRLVDIGIPNYLLTPSLILILGQRLARRLCPECKEAYEPVPDKTGKITFNCDLIYRPKGCEKCNNTGYSGRLVIAETLLLNDEIRELISQDANHTQILNAARKNGMTTIFESGLKAVERGLTSHEEICRVTVEL